jgi:hypothetical protein
MSSPPRRRQFVVASSSSPVRRRQLVDVTSPMPTPYGVMACAESHK